MGRAIFTDGVPALRVEGDMVFMDVSHREGFEVCVKMHAFEVFLERGRRAVAEWHTKQCEVVRLGKGKRRK